MKEPAPKPQPSQPPPCPPGGSKTARGAGDADGPRKKKVTVRISLPPKAVAEATIHIPDDTRVARNIACMIARKRILIASGFLSVLVLMVIPAYQPLKFHYAIWRIESAATTDQERAACILARRVGRVWEVNEIHPNELQSLPSRVTPGANDVVTEIEWWDGPWWQWLGLGDGQPYRAYRVLLDPKSRELLVAKPK